MKFMNLKRFASVAMAGALALSLASPAFAASNSVITGNYKEVRLAVSVPSTGKAVINPYGLPIALNDTYSISGQGISNAAPLTVQNRSAVPLTVDVSITGAVLGNFAFETGSSISTTETGNKGLVKFEMFPAPALTEATLENEDTLIGGFAALDSANALPSGGVQVKGVTGTPDAATNIMTLREGDENGSLQAGGAAYFRLTGQAVKKPNTAWAAADGFTATIAFSFSPSATGFALSAGTLAADTSATSANDPATGITTTGATIVLTSALPASLTPTSSNTVWSIDDTEKFTITPNTTDPLKAVVKQKTTATVATNDPVNITVTITDTNGIPYTATIAGKAA